MRHIALFFLLLGAFLMEWSMRGFNHARHELKVYRQTSKCYDEHTDEENWQ